MDSGSARGKELNEIMKRGELVPLEIVLELIREAIVRNLSKSNGYLIDGYPREKEQGPMFEKLVAPVDLILFFDASEDTLVKRLLHRGQSSGRSDDNEETIKLRLKTFNENSAKCLEDYTAKVKKVSFPLNYVT